MSTGYTIHTVYHFPESGLESAWRELLRRVEFPSHYCAPEFFKEPFWSGKNPFAVLALDHGRAVGVATGIHEGRETKCGLPNRPQISIDLTTDRMQAELALAEGLLAEMNSSELVSVYSWDTLESLPSLGFRKRPMEGDVMLDLTMGPELLFKKLDKKRRNNVRFAQKNGLEVFEATSREDLSAYYETFCAWRNSSRKKIVTTDTNLDLLENLQSLKSNRRFLLARHCGKVIAGIIFRYFPGGLMEYSANVSLDESLPLKPNDLLVWKAIEWGYAQGMRRFSLGGAHRFLREFGGIIAPIYRYRQDRTWLHLHDTSEMLADRARGWVERMPKPMEQTVRRVLGKS